MRRRALLWLLVPVGLYLLVVLAAQPVEHVLLGFNVGPETQAADVEYVLEELERRNITATFFVRGDWNVTSVEWGRHELACQTMTGAYLSRLNESATLEELSCKQHFENLTGRVVDGFREPGNIVTENIAALVAEAGYAYDASMLEGIGWFYPEPRIQSVKVTMLGPLPLDDSVLTRLLLAGDFAYFVMARDSETTVSMELRPELVREHDAAFRYLLDSYQEASFVTHRTYLALD